MKKLIVTCALLPACASIPALAQSFQDKPAGEISGCVDRQKAQAYVSSHNYAELLRGETADGKTYAVWTNGGQIMMVNYVKPPEPKADDFKICVIAFASGVTLNLEVIEKLIASGSKK